MATAFSTRLQQRFPDQLRAATEHAFLKKAGEGTLDEEKLCRWLVQDKYYQFAYIQFIGRIIAKIDLERDEENAEQEGLQWRALKILMGMLEGIKVEIEFYDTTVEKYGLKLQRDGPNVVSQAYKKLFEESSAPGVPAVRGLSVLWGTEFCYLNAWTFAKQQQKDVKADKGVTAALHQAFIPNWTCDEFKASVDELAAVLDRWAEGQNEEHGKCEGLWEKVLDLEAKFWPTV